MDPNSTTPTATHLQAQLQRKHAELQAIIGQQQAELRRVSEQLLMARLGLLATSGAGVHHQQIPQQSQQQMMHQQQQTNVQHHGQPQHTMVNISTFLCELSSSIHELKIIVLFFFIRIDAKLLHSPNFVRTSFINVSKGATKVNYTRQELNENLKTFLR